jgi:ferrous iron transport protein A
MDLLVPLACLPVGQTATIQQVLGNSHLVHRLHEMGLRGGVRVEMVQSGTPCIIRLGGQKLCLRADEITSVLVGQRASE